MKFQFLREVAAEAARLGIKRFELERQLAHFVFAQILFSSEDFRSEDLLVKGGATLTWRMESLSYRQTRDFDLVVRLEREEIKQRMQTLVGKQWGVFRVGDIRVLNDKTQTAIPLAERIVEFRVPVLIGNSEWLTVRLEVLPGADPMQAEKIDSSEMNELFARLGLPTPLPIPVLTIERQIAEKLHGLSVPESVRARDLYDLFHLAEVLEIDAEALRYEVRRVYEDRGSHPWNEHFVPSSQIERLYGERFPGAPTFEQACEALAKLQALIGPLT